jgi:DNA repair protein RadC
MKEYESYIPEITLKFKTGEIKKVQIKSSNDAADYMRLMYDADALEITESFIAMFLNRANNSIGWIKISQGGIAGTVVDVRLILATALKCGASGMIVAHNHPSGNLSPSDADIKITQKINKSGEIMDIKLLDHLIIVPGQDYYSFADNGML